MRYLSSLGHDVVDVRSDVFDVGDDYPPSCTETARLARERNDAQVVGARMHGPAEVAEIVEAFLMMPFSGGEWHARRIRLISDFEATGDAPLISAGLP